MDQRLVRDPINASEYGDFFAEYENFDHITKNLPIDIIKPNLTTSRNHAVLHDSSRIIRLRVIFNSASCRTTDGMSLNYHTLIGRKLQRDLAIVIMQWRQDRYVFTADIAKMYRQILVDTRDIDHQRIVWWSSPGESITEYRVW